MRCVSRTLHALVVVATLGGISIAQGADAGPKLRSAVRLPIDRLPEASGLAPSSRHAGLWWTHNDSGGRPELLALREDGTVAGVVRVSGVDATECPEADWEDLAPDGSGRLVIADIGDNLKVRTGLRLYRVPEPQPGAQATAPAQVFRFRYPVASGPVDAEGLVVAGGSAFVFTKEPRRTRMFRIPLPETPPADSVEAEPAGSLAAVRVVTGAALAPGDRRLAVLGYGQVTLVDLPQALGAPASPAGPLAGATIRRHGCPMGISEGVAWADDDLLIISESVPRPVLAPGRLLRFGPLR